MHAGSLWATLKDRPGYEIDERALRDEDTVFGSFEVRALSKTLFGVRASRLKVDYDSNDNFQGVNLQQELNVTTTTYGVTMRNEVTPLTSITIEATRSQDRFEYTPARNADSTTLSGTVTFDPAALIKGSATVGYRDFKPSDPAVPGYDGLTASANLVYTLLGSTCASGSRCCATCTACFLRSDATVSYLETGFDGSIAAQQIFTVPWMCSCAAGCTTWRIAATRRARWCWSPIAWMCRRLTCRHGGFGIHMGKNSPPRVQCRSGQPRLLRTCRTGATTTLKFGTSVHLQLLGDRQLLPQ